MKQKLHYLLTKQALSRRAQNQHLRLRTGGFTFGVSKAFGAQVSVSKFFGIKNYENIL